MDVADVLVKVWHEYRTSALLAIAILVGSYVWRRLASSRPRLSASPSSSAAGIRISSKIQWSQESPPVRYAGSHYPIIERGIGKPSKTPRLPPKVIAGSKTGKNREVSSENHTILQPLIFYFSLSESFTKQYAYDLKVDLQKRNENNLHSPQIYDLAVIDFEDFFLGHPQLSSTKKDVQFLYLLLVPSYTIDTTLDSFLMMLRETHNDFRINTAPLSHLAGYSVFGFGDREGWPTEADGYCTQAIETDKWMAKLTDRKRAFPLGLGDVKSDHASRFREWTEGVSKALVEIVNGGGLGEGVPGSGEAFESEDEDLDGSQTSSAGKTRQTSKRSAKQPTSQLGDLEDLGGKATASSPLPADFTTSSQVQTPKPMVPTTSPTHAALTKQGYTIIGTHSGVKICRWTKSALRGRGSCYKFSFYGIKSHLCMETTPSLSCSNKCVFCWRHGTNPVGTTWRWQIDPPGLIFQGAKDGHYKKIKMMRGVPGVRAERFQEAMKIRHCALSLVGEPIFYPHINEFLDLLHKEHISSFLVCNAQHPDQLAALKPVTQLYVSIDASNAESLRKIDRPLHRDYWQRFQRCLDILCEKRFRMRTVFRLTLVKGFNIEDEVEGYADLVAKGLPCFVEIKGVTYCGTSTSASAGLTMQNVPFYAEIVTFVEALNTALGRRGLEYGIAAEHAHSCCALIASRRFFANGKWHTVIDYDKFFECLERGNEFSPEDYMGPPTPEWATWGNGGFDPSDQRVDRKGRAIELGSQRKPLSYQENRVAQGRKDGVE